MTWSQTYDKYLNHTKWHAALTVFPEMEGEALRELAADIRRNGLLNPVVLSGTTVLDGRNRLLACKMANVAPTFIQWDPASEATQVSAVAWVISQNMVRRHFSASQRAAIALEVEKLLASEARKRQSTRAGGESRQLVEKLPQPEKGKARDKAGKLLKVSGRYVQDAKTIAKDAPELIPDIKAGRLTVSRAKDRIKQKGSVQTTRGKRDLRADARALAKHLRDALSAFSRLQSVPPSDWHEFLFLDGEGRLRRSKTSVELEQLCREMVKRSKKLFTPAPASLPTNIKELVAAMGPHLDSVFAHLPTSARQARVAALSSAINDRFERVPSHILGGAA